MSGRARQGVTRPRCLKVGSCFATIQLNVISCFYQQTNRRDL